MADTMARMTKNRNRRVARAQIGALCLLLISSFQLSFAQSITFNIRDAEISTVISTIAEVTGKSFIIDPRVKGKATVISSRPMTKDEAYQIFLSLLEVHGFAAIEVGETIKILPDVSAKQSPTPLSTRRNPGEGDEVVTQVIDVEYVAAAQLVPILRPLVPQQGHLVAYAPSNVLIISDRAANIKRLVELIRRVDKPSVENEIEVVALEHASAAEVVRILNTLIQQEAKGPGKKNTIDSRVIVADERTNSILLGGDKDSRIKLRAIIVHLDTPLETEGNIRVVYLRYAKAVDLVPVLTGVGQSIEEERRGAKGKATAPSSSMSIQADESTNALVITAPPDIFRSLQAVIRQLDMRRAQVSVEAIIAEISARRASELGVQWLFDGSPAGSGPVGAINFNSGGSIVDIASGIVAAQSGTGVPNISGIGGGITVGLGKFNSSSFNFAALVRALEGDGSFNVLSTPNIVTMDNVEAEIKVGQVVPFVTGSYTSPGGGGSTPTNPFQTINREDVGITLKVTPQINEGDAIRLDIDQSVSSISPSAVAAGTITNNRSIKTSVLAADGQTVVLGGLIKDDVTESVQKVPLLGDIPLLGAMFRYKTNNVEKTNLMVFIRPTILRDAAVTSQLTSSKYNFIRAKQMEVQRTGVQPLQLDQQPVLPEFKEVIIEDKSMPAIEVDTHKTGDVDVK